MKYKSAARTVIINDNNQVALIDVRHGEYYKIPGGGIETGESEETTAKREALEEADCVVELIQEIGRQEFKDSHPSFGETLHQSICFLAKIITNQNKTNFDSWEQSNDMKLIWVTFDEAIKLFTDAKPQDFFAKEINKRDLSFVIKAKELLKNTC
jgi:8-oxo-dGTP pyrophosphatase MutT (NUDIX family)